MKILLVEDDYQLSKAIETFLKIKKYEIETVSENMAIDLIGTNGYDLYIIDINLSNTSGPNITQLIKQKNKDSLILMLTASREPDNFLKAYENTCDEYLRKPFHLKELEVILNKLSKYKLRDYLKEKIAMKEN